MIALKYFLLSTQSQFSREQHQNPTMVKDTYVLVEDGGGVEDLWDFGILNSQTARSSPKREGDCLHFEKEVLAIQVGKYQKCEKE